jgi:hypothetical protein
LCRHYDLFGSTEEADQDISSDDLMGMFTEAFMDMIGVMDGEGGLQV